MGELMAVLEEWDRLIRGRISLIACGGTALTLQGIKASTKDIDFVVPDPRHYQRLIGLLKKLDYRRVTGNGWSLDGQIIFDLFEGSRVHTTDLLESPLRPGGNIAIKSMKRIYVGALNDLDLIISKMFRGTEVDVEDCVRLIRSRGNDFELETLRGRYRETAQFDVNEHRMLAHLEVLMRALKQGGAG